MANQGTSELALQWGLDQTVTGALSLGFQFVQIASQDNVQPIALMACEGFGNTLPICRSTRSTVEKQTRLKQEPVFLRFAKAVIRKAGGETLEKLSGNIAGLNFLALSAALVPTMNSIEAAEAIQRMIDISASDKRVVPPAHHVEAILDVLQPQLERIGFMEKCYQWDHWLRQHVSPYYDTNHQYPSAAGICQVVSALRNLRVGDANIDTLSFTCYSCAAWMVAFIEWCIGEPPSLFSTSGLVILPQPESRISLLIDQSHQYAGPIKIEMFHSSGSLYDTFRICPSLDYGGIPRTFEGMVNLRVHAEQVLQVLNADSGLALRAMLQALVHAIPQVQNLLIPTAGIMNEMFGASLKTKDVRPPENGMDLFTSVFPDKRKTYDIMRQYLGDYADSAGGFKQLPSGTTGLSSILLT